jgi:hypothetical protein
MQTYVSCERIALLLEYARNMQEICTNMQYIQSILYAAFADIYIPYFADAASGLGFLTP